MIKKQGNKSLSRNNIPHQKFCLNPTIESVQEIQFHKSPKYIVLEISESFMFIACNTIEAVSGMKGKSSLEKLVNSEGTKL